MTAPGTPTVIPTVTGGRKRKSAKSGRVDAEQARIHSADALATLVAIMTDTGAPAPARISAANAVLDRAWGKPRQDLDIGAQDDPVAAILRARQRVHEGLRRPDGEPDDPT